MKKILALIFALLMMTVFVGCNSSESGIIGGADEPDNVIVEGDADTEEEPESYVRIDALCDSDYNYYQLSMTDNGEKVTNNSIDVAGVYKENETVGEFLERCGYTDLAFAEEYDGFRGWGLYYLTDDGVSDSHDDILYLTEGMLEYIMPTERICFVAQWEDTPQDIYDSMGY